MSNCALCKAKPCRSGKKEGAPADCPSLKYSSEEMLALYSKEDIYSAQKSAQVEQEGYCVETRVEEIMDYAYKMGYKHLGLAFCVGFSEEAEIFVNILKSNGFEVDSVCCKTCLVPKTAIGIDREHFVRPQNEYEGMCNPAGQAKVLNDLKCDLAIIMGLCVGHDTLFMKNIEMPCTVLAVKDRAMGNNPMGAIYTANNYMKRQFSFIERKYGQQGTDK